MAVLLWLVTTETVRLSILKYYTYSPGHCQTKTHQIQIYQNTSLLLESTLTVYSTFYTLFAALSVRPALH